MATRTKKTKICSQAVMDEIKTLASIHTPVNSE